MKKINVELTDDQCKYIIEGLRNIVSGMRHHAAFEQLKFLMKCLTNPIKWLN